MVVVVGRDRKGEVQRFSRETGRLFDLKIRMEEGWLNWWLDRKDKMFDWGEKLAGSTWGRMQQELLMRI